MVDHAGDEGKDKMITADVKIVMTLKYQAGGKTVDEAEEYLNGVQDKIKDAIISATGHIPNMTYVITVDMDEYLEMR